MCHRHDSSATPPTDADSTYESLLGGDTTCDQKLDTAGVLGAVAARRDGQVVEPVGLSPTTAPAPAWTPTRCSRIRAGLMMVAGDPMPTEAAAAQRGGVVLRTRRGAVLGRRRRAPPGAAAAPCTFPDCWDGTRLDSDDHHAHVTFSHDGRCGDEHPVPIPQLQFAVDYRAGYRRPVLARIRPDRDRPRGLLGTPGTRTSSSAEVDVFF